MVIERRISPIYVDNIIYVHIIMIIDCMRTFSFTLLFIHLLFFALKYKDLDKSYTLSNCTQYMYIKSNCVYSGSFCIRLESGGWGLHVHHKYQLHADHTYLLFRPLISCHSQQPSQHTFRNKTAQGLAGILDTFKFQDA